MRINHSEYKYMKKIERDFSKNLKDSYEGNAVKAFNKSASLGEKASLIRDKVAMLLERSTTPGRKARLLGKYCETALPVLTRTFGEAALLNALPPEAKTEKAATICDKAGATELAKLCRLGMK